MIYGGLQNDRRLPVSKTTAHVHHPEVFFFLLQTQRHSYNRNLHYLQTLTVHTT